MSPSEADATRTRVTGEIFILVAAIALAGFASAQEREEAVNQQLTIVSPAFANGQPMPQRHTADGADLSPELTIAGPPEGTVSFALVMDDPDAPMGTWVHWVVWNVPASATTFPEGRVPAGAVEGRNSWGRTGYGGPSPPSGTHRYFFKLYALDRELDLEAGTDKAGLLASMEGRVLARAQVMGTYSR